MGRVLVHWCDDSAHYPAIIDDYNYGRYHLIYDDGHEEWIDLPSEKVIFMPLDWHESAGESGMCAVLYGQYQYGKFSEKQIAVILRRVRVRKRTTLHSIGRLVRITSTRIVRQYACAIRLMRHLCTALFDAARHVS